MNDAINGPGMILTSYTPSAAGTESALTLTINGGTTTLSSITVAAGVASQIAFDTVPNLGTSAASTITMSVTVQDAKGNAVAGATAPIFSLDSSPSGGGLLGYKPNNRR